MRNANATARYACICEGYMQNWKLDYWSGLFVLFVMIGIIGVSAYMLFVLERQCSGVSGCECIVHICVLVDSYNLCMRRCDS